MKRIAALLPILCLAACASAAFDRPRYAYYNKEATQVGVPKKGGTPVAGDWTPLDPTIVAHVEQYLRYSDATAIRLISQAETAKYLTELPIIGAGVFVPTSLALGKPESRAIYGAAVGSAGGLLSNYLAPRDRAATAAQAELAINCISSTFTDQMTQASSLGSVPLATDVTTLAISTGVATNYPNLQGEVGGAGRLAISAVDEIFGRVRLNLIKMGKVPDYAAIIKDMQEKMATSSAKAVRLATKGINVDQDIVAKHLSEYPLRISQCLSKYP